ncbi:MAG: porin [Bacteroidota bacterium]
MKKTVLPVLLSILLAGNLFAGGFLTGTQNARAMGMGHAFVGLANDASAIYFNPAGLANLKGTNVLFGTTFIMPTMDFTGPTPLTTTTSSVEKTFTPINLYGTYSMDNGLSFGIGVFNPYGLGSEWADDWIGKALAIETELRTFYINPTVAYKVSDNLSVGVGFDYIISNIIMSRRITSVPGVPVPTNIKMDLEGDGKAAYTFNFGVLFQATKDLSVGLAYRHSAEIEFDGEVKFSDLSVGIPQIDPILAGAFKTSKGAAKITMPYDLRVGLSYNAMTNLIVNADFQYVGWESYKELKATFDNPTYDMASPKNWENSMGIKVGGEYTMDAFAFRAGYVFDGNPIPTKYMDPSLPGADRHEFTLGLGYQITSSIRVDAAYQFISFENEVKDSALPFNGKYVNSTNLFGFNLGFAL